ncbi:hypothetical protein COO91_01537 [Nostoc flagelliforme CCNUN1]|uniref:Uncharacterized protein n=1 Tax=Nostoc flagelliforme CCNUN1 TaxID=2038116 RepID=A0A2K8SJP2_9NOSO|nr:hypothetical protein COO91_01537 [Nostoc flagelliforme CCNUN1]
MMGINNITVKYPMVIRQVQGTRPNFFQNGVLRSTSTEGDTVVIVKNSKFQFHNKFFVSGRLFFLLTTDH